MQNDISETNNNVGKEQIEQFLGLLTANHNRIYAYILSMVANATDADDLMQETTTVMWRKFSEFEPGTDFVRWGMAIARYQVLSFRKKRYNNHLQFSDAAVQALEADCKEVHSNIEARLEALHKCVEKLAPRDREVVLMRYKKDYSVRIISERVGRSIFGVYKTLARVHDMLLRCIRRTLAGEGVV